MNKLLLDDGFSLIEVIVALGIMVMMAAAVTPSMVSYFDRQRVSKGIEVLTELSSGVREYEEDVRNWPRSLSYLTSDITGSSLNACNSTIGNGDANRWSGPYWTRLISTSGLPVFIGTAQNELHRMPASGGTMTGLAIRVDNVRLEDAAALDDALDGDGSPTGGAVRWSITASSGNVVLDFVIDRLSGMENC